MPRMNGATPLKRGSGGGLASARSKTGDPACSQAMSAWVRGRKTAGGVPAEIFSVLARCRAKARALGKAQGHAAAGNDLKSQVWRKRAERGLSGAERSRKAAELRAGRKAKGPSPAARAAAARAERIGRTIPNPRARTPEAVAKAAAGRKARADWHRQDRANSRDARDHLRRATDSTARRQPLIHVGTGVEIKGEPGNAPHARISTARWTAKRMARAAELKAGRKPQAAPAKAPGRGTPERADKARNLAGMRRQLNNVKADLRHYDAKWGKRNDAIDDSRRDRLDELAFVRRQIAKARGKKARR